MLEQESRELYCLCKKFGLYLVGKWGVIGELQFMFSLDERDEMIY